MNDNIKNILDNLRSTQQQGGKVDSAVIEKMVEARLQQALQNPAIAEKILENLLSSSKETKKVMELKNIVKEGKESKTQKDIVPSGIESKVIDDLMSGNNVYLYGYAGTGKTFMAKRVAKFLQRSGAIPKDTRAYHIINCSQWTSPIEILGGFTITGYVQGKAIEAWSKGGVLILDELPKLDPNTAGLLNEMLASKNEEGATVTDANGKVHPVNPAFFVIGAGNTNLITVGEGYGGNNVQDYSLFDRFAGSMYVIEADLENEKKIIKYSVVFAISQGLRDFCLENKSQLSISIRTMENFARIYELERLRQLFGGVMKDNVAYYIDEKGNEQVAFNEPVMDGDGKTFQENINSFIKQMPREQQILLDRFTIRKESGMFEGMLFNDALANYSSAENDEIFVREFIQKRGWNPITGKAIK